MTNDEHMKTRLWADHYKNPTKDDVPSTSLMDCRNVSRCYLDSQKNLGTALDYIEALAKSLKDCNGGHVSTDAVDINRLLCTASSLFVKMTRETVIP